METNLNGEQLQAVKHGEGPLLVIAGAGTGKTTVITERIKFLVTEKLAKPSEILALTFTEKGAREMQERVDIAMPYGYTQMWISTFHSFCDRILRNEAFQIGIDPKYHLMTEAEAIQLLRKHIFELELEYFRPLGNPNKFLSAMLVHFSRLQDEDITPSQYFDWANKRFTKQSFANKEDELEARKFLELARAYRTYDEIKTAKGLMDFGDLIVKTLHLFRERPNILKEYQDKFKYILVDEFQDTNFAQNQLAILLAGENANINVSGDDDQCLPPDALIDTPEGTIPIKLMKAGDTVLTAVGKGHISQSLVKRVFKTRKKARFLTFTTESGKRLTLTDNHKMFCVQRQHSLTNNNLYYIYLMERIGMGYRIGITDDPVLRLRLERSADRIIVVKTCSSITEAHFYETVLSLTYKIPQYPFKPRRQMLLTGEWLEKLFLSFDTIANAQKLAKDLNVDLASHHFCLDGVVRGGKTRAKIILKMCERRYKIKRANSRLVKPSFINHLVAIESSSLEIKSLLENEGVIPTKAKKGWRVRRYFQDISEAGKFAKKLQNITGGIFEVRFDVGKSNTYTRSSLVLPAKNIFEGMYVPVKHGYEIIYEKVIGRTEETRSETVYDLEVDRTHNYIANSVVVHNSIYRFRGAAVSNIIHFRNTYPKAKAVVLTKNYRSTQEILDRAYDLIQHNNPDRLEVVENIDKRLIAQKSKSEQEVVFMHADRVENEADLICGQIEKLSKKYKYSEFAILVRANNHADVFSRCLARRGIPHQFLGPERLFKQPEVLDLMSYLRVLYQFEDSISFYRLLSIDELNIPDRDIMVLGIYAKKYNLSLFEAAEKVSETSVSEKGKEIIEKLVTIIHKHFGFIKKESAGQILYDFLEETGLLPKLLKSTTVEAERKASNISRFFDKLKTFEVDHEDASVPTVVEWIDLASELGESPLSLDSDWTQINAVNILTVHSSKGLEFPVVFLVNLVSQRFPTMDRKEQIPIPEELIKEVLPEGDSHLQEERRLFYVGMTRAKNRLFFTAADYYGEGKREKSLSPFIFEALGEAALTAEVSKSPQQLSFMDFAQSNKKSQSIASAFHIDYLSHSQIETFKVCPMHYKLRYILKIPTPPSAPLSVGVSIHAALKEFYLTLKMGTKESPKLLIDLLQANWVKLGFKSRKHESENFERAKKYLLGYYEETFSSDNLPILVEQPFVAPLTMEGKRSLKIGGVMDRVDEIKNGKIEIIDYKTGEKVPTQKEVDKNEQLTLYALAASLISGSPFEKTPGEVLLSLYYFESQEKLTTTRTAEQLEDYKKELFRIREEIENSDFSCSRGFLCQNCEYSFLCNS